MRQSKSKVNGGAAKQGLISSVSTQDGQKCCLAAVWCHRVKNVCLFHLKNCKSCKSHRFLSESLSVSGPIPVQWGMKTTKRKAYLINKYIVGFNKRYYLLQTSTPYNESLKKSMAILTYYTFGFMQWQLAVKTNIQSKKRQNMQKWIKFLNR